MRKALHGKTAEKLSDDERQLILEDLEAALLEVETVSDAAQMMQQLSQAEKATSKAEHRQATGACAPVPCPYRLVRFDCKCIVGLWSIGTVLSGAGGRWPNALCGLTVL